MISENDVKSAAGVLHESVGESTLSQVLSEESVYLPLQSWLIKNQGDLASITVRVLGTALLQNKTILRVLTGQEDISPPKPGSQEMLGICADSGLSDVFAGLSEPENTTPSIEVHWPSFEIPPLFEYQREVIQKGITAARNKIASMISLPTGSGKTRVAAELIQHFFNEYKDVNYTTIWIAHTEELCEQAINSINQVFSSNGHQNPYSVIRTWGRFKQKLERRIRTEELCIAKGDGSHLIIFGTPISVSRLLDEDSSSPLATRAKQLDLLVIDEAHRAAANSYTKTIDFANTQKAAVIGLSATPVRATYSTQAYKGTKELLRYFHNLIEPTETLSSTSNPEEVLRRMGVLSELEIDYIPMDRNNTESLADHISSLIKKKKIKCSLGFVDSIGTSKALAALLRHYNIKAESLTADTNNAIRKNAIRQLRDGEIQIIINCELLTTGLDVPAISDLFIARQTSSIVLYKQMLGRGLRGPAVGGNENCKVHLLGVHNNFEQNPSTEQFTKAVWDQRS
jgi:superfamily II DNA or RNA helicase